MRVLLVALRQGQMAPGSDRGNGLEGRYNKAQFALTLLAIKAVVVNGH